MYQQSARARSRICCSRDAGSLGLQDTESEVPNFISQCPNFGRILSIPLGGFLHTQSAEITQFHDAALPRIDLGKRIQRPIQGQYLDAARLYSRRSFVQRDLRGASAALGIPAVAGVVHEYQW